MSHFKLLAALGAGIYLAECFLWIGADGWLFLAWGRVFALVKGPAARFRNPWPMGFAFRFRFLGSRPGQRASLSMTAARNQWEAFQRMARVIGGLGQGLVAVAVSAILLYILRRGFNLAWAILLSLFLIFHFSIVLAFWRAHGKLYPGNKSGRIKGTLLCFFSPWQTARAADLLGDSLWDGFHPLVAARLLLPEGDFQGFARRWILELRYPDLLRPEGEGRRLYLRSTAAEEDREIEGWILGLGLNPDTLLQPPVPSHPSHLSYCPRCRVEYGIPPGKCGDCGRDLIPFRG